MKTCTRPWIAALFALTAGVVPAHALRVTSWNLLNYTNPATETRHPTFRTVFGALDTDVLVTQEMMTQEAADSFLTAVLRPAQPARRWKLAGFIAGAESGLYYDSLAVSFTNLAAVPTAGPRDVLVAIIRPNGYAATSTRFRVYSVHFKAGNPSTTPADSATRRAECTDLRNSMNLAPAGTNILMGGDTNFYGSWEGGYAKLTESQADNDGRLKDLIPFTGTWNNPAYALHHTQSPCLNCPPGFSGGGMDDRFDLWLHSFSLQDGEGLDIVTDAGQPTGTFAFGNDGLHYNGDIDGNGFNTAVPLAIATALRNASDHLPVVVTLSLPAKVSAPSALAFGDAILGSSPSRTLNVGHATPAPADTLEYTLAASAGFTAPPGGFAVRASQPANAHAVGMDASTLGLKSGTLTVSSNDPDSANKLVQVSGRVVTHADGSLDSLASVTTALADFGSHTSGGFVDQAVRVHNRGGAGLQARLAVQSATISGGAGRFTLASGVTPTLLAGVGATWTVHFDDAGATPDSTYEATLTFAVADDAIPGGTTLPALTVTLRARRTAGGVGVPGAVSTLRFMPPRPNPIVRDTELAFELPRTANVEVTILDLAGRRVATLVDGRLGEGRHALRWSPGASQARAGLYFVRFATEGLSRTERVIVLP